jgi:uncharacterized protein with LGFP repeats
MDINKRVVVVALVFFMLVVSSSPQVPASAQLQHCTNTGFADAIRNKAATLQGLGGMIEGPFAIGGGNFASYLGRPKFVDAGCFARYANGMVYIHKGSKPTLVYGLIFDKWGTLDWERGALGYPISDEQDVGKGTGRVTYFQFGAIYWKKGTPQAFAVYGAIGSQYIKWGGPATTIGYPTEDEKDWNNFAIKGGESRVSFFENGRIFWTRTYGVVGIWGYVFECWLQRYEHHRQTTKDQVFYIVSGADISGNGDAGVIYFSGTWGKLYADKKINQCRTERRFH